MAESSWPSPSNSHTVDDASYEKLAVSYGPVAGVVGDFTSPQLVYGDASGMQVKVAASRYATVGGHEWTSGSTIFTLAIAANSSGSTRTDLVVLRLSRTTWNVNATVITGTPGSGAPSPVQNTGTTGSFDLPLATVTVASGASSISAANVTYLASHLASDGSGIIVNSQAALSYVPVPLAGQTATLSDGTQFTWTGSAWKPVLLFVRKTASENLTSSTTLQNDDQLFLSVAANAFYEVRLWIRAAAQTTDDIKVNFTAPSGSSFDWIVMSMTSTAASFGDDQTAIFVLGSTPTFGGLGGTNIPIYVTGLLATGSSAGTFQFQWAQGTSSTNGVTVLSGSWMRLDRVA